MFMLDFGSPEGIFLDKERFFQIKLDTTKIMKDMIADGIVMLPVAQTCLGYGLMGRHCG
jgi:hypothetical protein